MVDPGSTELAPRGLRIDPGPSAGGGEAAACLSLLHAQEPGAWQTLFGGIDELDREDVVRLPQARERGQRGRVVAKLPLNLQEEATGGSGGYVCFFTFFTKLFLNFNILGATTARQYG